MTWLWLSLLSAFFESVKDAFGKASTQKISHYAAALSLHIISLLISIPLVIAEGVPKLTTPFWIGTAAFIIITPAWSILYMKALQSSELSKVIPVMAFNPLFTALLSYFFADQSLTIHNWLGIVGICLGMYLVYLQPKIFKTDPLSAIKELIADKGARAMLSVSILWSFGAHFSKIKVAGSSPIFSSFTGALVAIITIYALAWIRKQKIDLRSMMKQYKQLLPVGISYYLATIISSFALVSGSATLVFATKRSSIVMSSIAGNVFFKESINKLKSLGIAIIMIGVILLAI